MEQKTYSHVDRRNFSAQDELISRGRYLHDRTIGTGLLRAFNICKSASNLVDIDCSVENPKHVKSH